MTQTPELPDVLRTYLDAHASRDVDRALSSFTPDAEVTDEGRTYRGTDEVRAFLSTAGAEYTYTTRLVAAEQRADDVWVAHQRIEGDFPGGVADLAYRIALSDGLVTRLDIG